MQERKLVTVVFADLAGSTELATHLDPERYREVMQAFYQMVSRELASLRGRAEKFVGSLIIHREGNPEPVESVTVEIKRTVLAELHESLGRLLARSTGVKRRTS